MFKKWIFLFALVFLNFVYAARNEQNDNPLNPQNFRPLNNTEQFDERKSEDLKIKEFYLGIGEDEIKEVQDKDKSLQETFDKFDESILNYKPVLKPINSIDSIETHPYFTTTFLLPAGAKISSVDISQEPITLKYQENTILLRVKNDFNIANLTAIYSLDGKNYVLNTILKRYDRSKTDEKLNLVYSYKAVKQRDDFEVLQTFVRTYGRYPNKTYNYILIDDIVYRIIKDDKFGRININNTKYRVDTGTEN